MANLRTVPCCFLLALAGALVGCAPEHRAYDVLVRNESSHPVSLVLTKDGPPASDKWMSPEEVLKGDLRPDQPWGLGALPPGRTATAENVTGEFQGGSKAWLRVYRGDLTLGEMVKVGPGSPDRQDVALKPGKNAIVVRDVNNRLSAEAVSGVPTRP